MTHLTPQLYSFLRNWLERLERMSNRRRVPWLKPWAKRARTFLFPRDDLTGLLRRFEFIKRVEGALDAGKSGALLLIDIDGFAYVNLTLTHVNGDKYLRHVAALLRDTGPRRLLCRFGGGEFAMYTTNAAEAEELAERLRFRIERDKPLEEARRAARSRLALHPNFYSGPLLTVSIGVVHVSPGRTVEQLMKAAEDARYAAKIAGRNRVATSTPNIEKAA